MSGWTDEKKRKARRMYEAGAGAAYIARCLGLASRNMVVGMAWRQGWTRIPEAAVELLPEPPPPVVELPPPPPIDPSDRVAIARFANQCETLGCRGTRQRPYRRCRPCLEAARKTTTPVRYTPHGRVFPI